MNGKLIFVASLCIFGVVSATYSDCGSAEGQLINVSVSGCAPTAKKCILKRNNSSSIEITFKSKVESESLKADVYGILLDVPIPFALPNDNACLDSGISCPIKADTQYTYKATLPIKNEYPKVTVNIKWELLDKDGKAVVCALIPAKIQ